MPSPGQATERECPPSLARTLLARGKLALVASRISPKLCTPGRTGEGSTTGLKTQASAHHQGLTGFSLAPVAPGPGRSGQWGGGSRQITFFAHLQLGLLLELQNQVGLTG